MPKKQRRKHILKQARRLGLIPSKKTSAADNSPTVVVQVHLRDEVGKAVRLAVVDLVKRRVPGAQVLVVEESTVVDGADLHILKTDSHAGLDYAGQLRLAAALRPVVDKA